MCACVNVYMYANTAEDEPNLAATQACNTLENNGGDAWRPNTIDAGQWGRGEARNRRVVFKSVVKTRTGTETVELQLTVEGFVFVAAEGFKCVAVRRGELMQVIVLMFACRGVYVCVCVSVCLSVCLSVWFDAAYVIGAMWLLRVYVCLFEYLCDR